MPRKYRGRMTEERERDVAAHRQAADDRLIDVQPVEEIDEVAGEVVDRRSHRRRRRAVEPAELRRDHAPARAASASCGSHMRALSGKPWIRTSVPVSPPPAPRGRPAKRTFGRQRFEVVEPARA